MSDKLTVEERAAIQARLDGGAPMAKWVDIKSLLAHADAMDAENASLAARVAELEAAITKVLAEAKDRESHCFLCDIHRDALRTVLAAPILAGKGE